VNVESLPIAELHSDPVNARVHPDPNLKAIAASLARFGQQKPIVVDTKNVIRAGNGLVEAAHTLGWQTIQAVRSELQGTEATAFAIADNRTAELARWDEEILAKTLGALQAENFPTEAVGFTDEEITELLDRLEVPEFLPDTIDGQSQLDEKAKVTCPECGHEFRP